MEKTDKQEGFLKGLMVSGIFTNEERKKFNSLIKQVKTSREASDLIKRILKNIRQPAFRQA